MGKNRHSTGILFITIFLLSLHIPIIEIVDHGNEDKSKVIIKPAPNDGPPLYTTFNASNAYYNMQQQIAFGDRIPGSNAGLQCAQWIANQMDFYGHSQLVPFTVGKDDNKEMKDCNNVLGIIENQNQQEENVVILAAHYDSRAVAEKDDDPTKQNLPIDGANDGGSGVGVLIEIARIISQQSDEFGCDFWFMFFDAEDQGQSRGIYGLSNWDWCEGSKWMANELEQNPGEYFAQNQGINSIESFILLDMVGGINLEYTLVSPYDSQLYDQIFSAGRNLGYTDEFPLGLSSTGITDDHVYFDQLGIPVFDMIIEFWDENSGWPYHHTHDDSLENISTESLNITGRTVLKYLEDQFLSTEQDDGNSGPNGTGSDNGEISSLWDELAFRYVVILFSCVAGVVFVLYVWNKKKIRESFE